jgi:hypothetical protein
MEDFDMKSLLLALLLVTAALFAASPTLAAEYFVIKSQSGILKVVDHKPQGGATIVSGPMKTKEEADKAMKSAMDAKTPDAKAPAAKP